VNKRPVVRPRIKWKDVIGNDLKMIHENVKMEDANDRIMVAAMDHRPIWTVKLLRRRTFTKQFHKTL